VSEPFAQLDCRVAAGTLDAYLDGDLEVAEAKALEAHLATGDAGRVCATCARALDEARRLRDALRALPTRVYPQARVERAITLAREEVPRGTEREDVPLARAEHWHERPSSTLLPWLALAASLLVVAILVRVSLLDLTSAPSTASSPSVHSLSDEEVASTSEVAAASEQARWALSYVAAVSRRSARVLRDDVLVDEVVGPSARALGRSLDPLVDAVPFDSTARARQGRNDG
jgi:anti-sigma factor RsiW